MPPLGARVALAAARARVDGADAGIAALECDADPLIDRFQPAWATRAHLLAEAARFAEAASAYRRAISLTTEPAIRGFLEDRLRLPHQRALPRREDPGVNCAVADGPMSQAGDGVRAIGIGRFPAEGARQ
jgi:hypothetical protein